MKCIYRLKTPGSSRLPAFSVLAALIALSAPQASIGSETARNEVRCTEIAFSQSIETGDSEAFASFLDDDARFVGQGVLRGKSEVIAGWAPFFSETGPELIWRPYIVEVAAPGNIALSRGPYRMRSVNGEGQTVESWGIYNSVWRSASDGGWKIIFDAGSPGEEQLTGEMKALIEQPVENCAD